jgi:hypothetical protein
MGFQGHQGGFGSQEVHEVFESLMCFFGPSELVLLFEELDEWAPPDVES